MTSPTTETDESVALQFVETLMASAKAMVESGNKSDRLWLKGIPGTLKFNKKLGTFEFSWNGWRWAYSKQLFILGGAEKFIIQDILTMLKSRK